MGLRQAYRNTFYGDLVGIVNFVPVPGDLGYTVSDRRLEGEPIITEDMQFDMLVKHKGLLRVPSTRYLDFYHRRSDGQYEWRRMKRSG